jgi:hypothetical protein
MQSDEAILVLGHIEPDEPPGLEILAHHRFGHVAPTDAFLHKHVLCTEIGQPPSLGADDAEILALCALRAVGEHQLDVLAPGARRIATRPRQRMIGSGNRDELDAAHPDALEP